MERRERAEPHDSCCFIGATPPKADAIRVPCLSAASSVSRPTIGQWLTERDDSKAGPSTRTECQQVSRRWRYESGWSVPASWMVSVYAVLLSGCVSWRPGEWVGQLAADVESAVSLVLLHSLAWFVQVEKDEARRSASHLSVVFAGRVQDEMSRDTESNAGRGFSRTESTTRSLRNPL